MLYRLLPGNIRDVSAFKLSIAEANIKDAIIIADKGFYSKSNIDMLEENKLKYIIPLRRKNVKINYKLERKNYFKYKNKYIWYYQDNDNNIISFLDEELKIQETKDYLDRISSCSKDSEQDDTLSKYSIENFEKNHNMFGTFTITTNLFKDKTVEEIYCIYKSRCEVEIMAENLKTTLNADVSYMRDDKHLEGWMFVNYIALLWYYKIYNLLLNKSMLKHISPSDLLLHLSEIRKIKINDVWYGAEVSSKTKRLLEKLGIDIT
jgi:transposase